MKYHNPIVIVHLITTLDVGGAEMMLLKLLTRMNREVFKSHVVSLSTIGPIGKKISDEGIPVFSLGIRRNRLTLRKIIRLWRLMVILRPDVVQTWLYHSDILGFFAAKSAGVKNVCWNIRGSQRDFSEYGFSTRFALKLCAYLSRFPRVVIANSEAGVKVHNDLGYSPREWLILPNGVNLDRFKPDDTAKSDLLSEISSSENDEDMVTLKNREGDKRPQIYLVGLIARYAPIKDHATFIKGACLILKNRNDVHFILAGRNVTWENRELCRQIPDEFRDKFHLLGEISDVYKITAALDVASLVSYGEGFSNVICEAMACEVPCVVTDVGDSARIVGETGKIIPVRNPEAFAEAVENILALSSEERKRIGKSARDRIRNKYSLDKIVGEYERLYLRISSS